MRFIIQRVSEASVTVEDQTIGKIQKGFLVLIGVSDSDTQETANKLIKKMIGLRKDQPFSCRCKREPSSGFSVHTVCQLQKGQPSKLYRSRYS